jgi:hypothetical protein
MFLTKITTLDLHQPWICPAVKADSSSSVIFLLENGSDVNAIESGFKTALDYALEAASKPLLRILLSYHAKSNLQWNIDSSYIQQWAEEPWFSSLIQAVAGDTIPLPWSQGLHIYKGQQQCEGCQHHGENTPYLTIIVLEGLQDVQAVIFEIDCRGYIGERPFTKQSISAN